MGSEAKWTPEPWRIVGKDCDDDHRRIVQTSHVTRDVREIPRVPADLDRIVACVNALSGVAAPEAELRRLRAIEVAAKEYLVNYDNPAATLIDNYEARAKLRTALARHGQGGGE